MADIRIRGAKAGQKEPRKPNISKDTAASISTAKLLYGLAEGEIYGLADGAKSIRLDGTPLVDDAGNPNFEGVTWDFRNGSNDQEYIKGFPDVSNETPINVELRSSQPWIKAFNDTQISAVRVRFKWNRLSETNGENGDVKGYKIDYAIDLQTDGGAYQTVLTTKIQDKTSAGYERTHRIDLPKAKTGWQLRVRRITPNSTSDLIQDTMMIDAVAEVIDVKLSYPNTALLGVQYNAELFSNIAKMSVRVKGKIIRVPDNYDPVARTYTGIWTGNFKDAYSNNPAWIFYDLCTQWRGGLGERLDATMIDRWSLYALGQYCDQPVSDGQGGLEPRFTCNVYLQKQEEAYTVLQNIAGIFRAMSFWTGERIMLDADVPQDSIYTYSAANIVGGVAGIQYSGTRNRDRHTLAKVAWDNPNNDYQTEYEYIRDEKAMSKFGVKVLDLSAFGCTSQAQAQRAGLWALKTEQLETRQVTFSVGLDGAIPTVGNIISLSDEAFAGRANGGRVSTVNSTQRIIELDREVTASVGDVLIINGGSGKSERRNISNVVGNRITVTAGFTSAEPEHVWAIETADLKLMRFRVMSITENDDATYAITGIQHEPQKYDAIDFGTDVKPTEITIVNPETVDAPAAVSITSRHREVQGQMITTLVIGWSQVKGAVAYDAEWRKDDGTWVKVPRTGNVSVEIEGVYSGNYMARVRAISAFDVQSNPTTSILTEVKGKIGLPPTVVGLTPTGILFGMDLKWGFAAGSGDAAFTEVQVGSAPNVNVATLTQVSYPTNTHTITGLQGNLNQSYRARLVDKLGFKSPWSAWVTGTTDANADKILDLIQGQINEGSLNQSLTTKINKIAVNTAAISQETTDRIAEILAANGRINTERDARIADVLAANNSITAEQQARIAGLLAANEGITTETTQRKAANVAINSRVDTVVSKTDGNTAAISSEVTARTSADSALGVRIDAVVAKSGDNTAAITSEALARTNADTALSTRIDTVTAESSGNKTAIQTEVTARTTADTALGQRIDTVTTSSGTNTAAIQTEVKARTNADTALSTRIDTVVSKSNNNEAAISSEVTARTDGDSALSGRIDTVSSKTDTNTATITNVNNTLTNELGSQSEQINVMRADYKPQYADASQYADAARSVQWTYWKTVARDGYATNERITVLQSDVASNNATITQSLNTLATKDEALASSIETLSATTGANTAAIQSEATARSNADTALGQRVDTVQSSTATAQTAANNAATAAGNKGEVIFGSTTPVAAKRLAQNLWIDTTGGKNTPKRWDGSAWSIVTDKAATDAQSAANAAQATATEALGKANTATSNIATIRTELTATTSKTNATATSVGTLQTTVAGNTASIQTAQSSIDGINLQYTVKLDSGGKISGFGLMNDGATSAFDVRADRFSISAPSDKPNDVNGTSQFMVINTPTVIDGVSVPVGAYTRNFYAPRASIDTIQVKDAAIKTAQIDDLAVTTGKIANLSVDTLKIADYAVTIPVAVSYPDKYIVPLITSAFDYKEVMSITIPSSMGDTSVQFSLCFTAQGTTNVRDISLRIIVDNDIVTDELVMVRNSGAASSYSDSFSVSRLISKRSTDAVVKFFIRHNDTSTPIAVSHRYAQGLTVRK